MSNIRRINLFGGPNTGKTDHAMGLARYLRRQRRRAELVGEVVKLAAYEKKPVEMEFQMYTFGLQVWEESKWLRNGVDLIVTDSPLLLQCHYSRMRGETFWEALLEQSNWIERRYPSLNIFLGREGVVYSQEGRYQTEEEAKKVDQEMREFLDEMGVCYTVIPSIDETAILDYVNGFLSMDEAIQAVKAEMA
jgi:hypothetical protein